MSQATEHTQGSPIINKGPPSKVSQSDEYLDPNLQKLIESQESKFKTYWFSQRFIDKSVEAEYTLLYQKDMVPTAVFYCYSQLIITVVFMICQLKTLQTTEDYPNYKYLCIANGFLIFVPVAHLILSYFYRNLGLYFASVQTPLFLLTLTEMRSLVSSDMAMNDGNIVSPILLVQLASISFCSKQITISYIITLIYNVIRSRWMISDHFKYFRFNVFWTFIFLIIYIMARRFNQRNRDDFKKKRSQILMLKMFDNLIKVFHDGIIITQQEQIIYENTQISKIFESSEVVRDLDEGRDEEIGQFSISGSTLLQSLKETFLTSDQEKSKKAVEKHQSLWQMMQSPCHQSSSSINGLYFKFKDPRFPHVKSKKLQVFSQAVGLPCSHSQQLCMHTVRDMSQWLEAQQQKLASQFKTVAFASAAHEFRNPLNGIVQALDLLKGKIDMQQCGLSFRVAKNCSKLMLFLVNDILDYAQFESKQIQINWEEVSIFPVLKECIDIMKFQANAKGISLGIAVDECAPASIFSDKQRIRQVLINLLSNAIKYTEHGYVKVHVSCSSPSQHHLEVSVEDSGVGIDPEGLKVLFQTFTKLKQDRHLNKQGCGLGLAICKSIATALRGEILVKSKRGQGSVFTLVLPLRQSVGLERKQTHQLQFKCSKLSFEEKDELSGLPLKNNQEDFQQQDSSFFKRDEECDASTVSEHNHFIDMQMKCLNQPSQKRKKHSHHSFQVVHNDTSRGIDTPSHFLHKLHSSRFERSRDPSPSRPQPSWFPASPRRLKEPNSSCRCAQVLLADDEPFNLIVLESMLEEMQVKSEKVFNGQDVLQQVSIKSNHLGHQPYKLIVLDNQMPGMTGIEAAKEIRKRQMEGLYTFNFKLVLLSGNSPQQMEKLLESADLDSSSCKVCQGSELFDFILEKPLNRKDLEMVLKVSQIEFVRKGQNERDSDDDEE